jgi:hypothetical protein
LRHGVDEATHDKRAAVMRISPEGKISLEDHADTVGLVGMITSFRSPNA